MALPPELLKTIPLEPEIREAVEFAGKMKKHGARRRQLQYIGSLMRQVDPEPIITALAHIAQGQQADFHVFKLTETWRNQLLAGNDDLVKSLTHRFPDINPHRFIQMIDRCRADQQIGDPSKSARQLFRFLKPFANRWVHNK